MVIAVAVVGMLIGTIVEVRLINRSLPRAGRGDATVYVELLDKGVEA